MTLQSHGRAHMKSDIFEDLETQLKTCGPTKERNIFTSYLDAAKTQ